MSAYSTSEFLAYNIARQIDDSDVVVLGSFTPLAYTAYLLAKMTHAPNMTYIAYSAIDALPFRISFTTSEAAALSSGAALAGMTEIINWIHQTGSADVEAVSGAQIDARGDINLSVIGSYDDPKVRLPGGAGVAEVLKMHRKMIAYVPHHDPRILVPKVHFITGSRWKRGDEERRAAHLNPGPMRIVSSLCVLGWSAEADGFCIEALAPDVTCEQVQEQTGFPLAVPEQPQPMPEPGDDEIRLIREQIDPFGTREFDFKTGRDRLGYLKEMFEREYALTAEVSS